MPIAAFSSSARATKGRPPLATWSWSCLQSSGQRAAVCDKQMRPELGDADFGTATSDPRSS